jgi:hypothetical protein
VGDMDGLTVVCALDGAAVVGELEGLAVDGSLDGASSVMGEFDGAAIVASSVHRIELPLVRWMELLSWVKQNDQLSSEHLMEVPWLGNY